MGLIFWLLGFLTTAFCPVLDTMDKWDQNKLEEVIEKKHGEKEKSMPKTEIVRFDNFYVLFQAVTLIN